MNTLYVLVGIIGAWGLAYAYEDICAGVGARRLVRLSDELNLDDCYDASKFLALMHYLLPRDPMHWHRAFASRTTLLTMLFEAFPTMDPWCAQCREHHATPRSPHMRALLHHHMTNGNPANAKNATKRYMALLSGHYGIRADAYARVTLRFRLHRTISKAYANMRAFMRTHVG